MLGTSDHNISVLLTGEDPGIADDEITVLDRDELDEGAVPRDMILPRPAKPRTKAPTKPRTGAGTGLGDADAKKLADFRALLKRAHEKAKAEV